MRVLSLLGRTGLRSPRLLGSTPRALPVLTVRQQLLSTHKALPRARAVPTITHEQPNLHVLQLVAAGSVLGVLAQSYEPASCGKRKKKGTDQADDMYEVDYIKARKLEKGVPKYLISWKGYADSKHDTWEGLENLAGIEQDIAAFEARQKKENEDFAAALAERKRAKAEEAKAIKARAALPGAGNGAGSGAGSGEGSSSDAAVVKQEGLGGRRSNPFWAKVKPSGNIADPSEYLCQEPDPTKPGGICGCSLHPGSGASAIKRHFQAKHKRSYQEISGYLDGNVVDAGWLVTDGAQRTIQAAPFTDARKDECNMACARWLVKSARPITLPERDKPFRDFIGTLCRGAWDAPSHHAINDCILKLSGMGQVRLQRWFTGMVIDGVKPSMAGDIWSDGGCSLMGICMYGINSSWKMDEWLAAATPFGSERHTGEAIDRLTVEALQRQGIKWREGGSVYEAIHGKVSDNASNMAKGWAGFEGGFCADHTIELAVKKFTGAHGVKDTFARAKGIVGYFRRSTAGIQDLTAIQKACSLPQVQPIQDVATRWFSSYGMVDWFREQQQAVQMYAT